MYCRYCGAKIADESIFCFRCGRKVQPDADFCPPKTQAESSSAPVSPTMTSQNPIGSAKTNKKKKGLIIGICFALVALIIVGIVLKTENSYSIKASSYDFTYFYDDSDGKNVVSVITPKYDLKDLCVSIKYKPQHSLIENYYTEQFYIGDVKAGVSIRHSRTIADVEKNFSGEFYCASIDVVSGSKQYKNASQPSQDTDQPNNTECSFKVTARYDGYEDHITFEITNTSNRSISELRDFSILVQYEEHKSLKFYSPRLKFPEKVAPGQTVTINDAYGNMTFSGISFKQPFSYTSSNYSKATYQVIGS